MNGKEIRSFRLEFSNEKYGKYALTNYKEIIDWYKQPFYKKWFSNPPIKNLIKFYFK
jgi:hypothetical protein